MKKHTTSTAIPTYALKAEALASMSASFERFCLAAGLETLSEMLEQDATAACGERHERGERRQAHRWGRTKGKIGFHGVDAEIARLIAGGEGGDGTATAARSALADAEDGLDVARKALAKIEGIIVEYEKTRARAEDSVKAAIAEIAAAALGDLLAEGEALRRQLDANYSILRYLGRLAPAGNAAAHRASHAIPSAPPGEPMAGRPGHPAVEPWRAAI